MNNVDFKNRIAALKRGTEDEDDSFLYVKRNAAPAWALRPKGSETPSEKMARCKEMYRLFDQCARAVENV